MAFLLFILLTGLIKLFTLLYKYSVEKKDDTTRKAIWEKELNIIKIRFSE